MAYQPIDNSEIVDGSVLDSALLFKIKNNFEIQQTDLAAKDAALSSQASIISKTVPIGTYINSDLTLAQFQSETPGVWMLANGGSCTGTAYATKTGRTNVPDMRGVYMRAKDNGRGVNPDGDLALGAYTADAQQNITGTMYSADVGVTRGASELGGAFYQYGGSTYLRGYQGGGGAGGLGFDSSRQVRTAAEVRPKSVTVNVFIKVGY